MNSETAKAIGELIGTGYGAILGITIPFLLFLKIAFKFIDGIFFRLRYRFLHKDDKGSDDES